ncbi:MAG TPA: type II toxin-antitoxin system RelE/ParE family toxin [Acetobacteraceae bacterium]|nr:type II toxin-antitoxin system RelE/ParE family toxin [Acetobacteraceae bacterium]
MPWQVELHDELIPEVDDLPPEVQKALAAHIRLLVEFGPGLGRPSVDTLKGSRIANLKELRFSAEGGVWRGHSRSIETGSRSCWWPVTSVA